MLIGLASTLTMPPLRSQPRSTLTIWAEVAKVLGDVGSALSSFSRSVEEIADRALNGYDRVKRRQLRAALIRTSVKLTSLIADQEKVKIALDRYGDLWRTYNRAGYRITSLNRRKLAAQWQFSVSTINLIATQTAGVLNEIRTIDSDVALDEAYAELQMALTAKVGTLETLARTPPPSNPAELRDLVENEETFLHLRAEARSALAAVNRTIRSIRT
jgi:hypothetical protein